mmetsp:Transcript_23852/g.64980  ORF Transcript_23852/g.64980 Transcript_23852/m.64980 type:complete len:267 (+) Transcript_23852:937-1737(+)
MARPLHGLPAEAQRAEGRVVRLRHRAAGLDGRRHVGHHDDHRVCVGAERQHRMGALDLEGSALAAALQDGADGEDHPGRPRPHGHHEGPRSGRSAGVRDPEHPCLCDLRLQPPLHAAGARHGRRGEVLWRCGNVHGHAAAPRHLLRGHPHRLPRGRRRELGVERAVIGVCIDWLLLGGQLVGRCARRDHAGGRRVRAGADPRLRREGQAAQLDRRDSARQGRGEARAHDDLEEGLLRTAPDTGGRDLSGRPWRRCHGPRGPRLNRL